MSAETDKYPLLPFQDIRKKPVLRMDTLTDARTDGQTDRWMDNVTTVYVPLPPTTHTHTHTHTNKQSLWGIKTLRHSHVPESRMPFIYNNTSLSDETEIAGVDKPQ